MGFHEDILKEMLPAEYAGRHSSNRADALEAEKYV